MYVRNWYERMISLEYGFSQSLHILVPQIMAAIHYDGGELFRELMAEMSKRFDGAAGGEAAVVDARRRLESRCAFETCAVVLAARISDVGAPRRLLEKGFYGGRVRALCRKHGSRGILRRIERHEWPSQDQFAMVLRTYSTSGQSGRPDDQSMLELLARGGPAALFAVSLRATIDDAFEVPRLEVGRHQSLLHDVMLPFLTVRDGYIHDVAQKKNRRPVCVARRRIQHGEVWRELACDWDELEEASQLLRLLRLLGRLLRLLYP
jgi:hypothetical protein